MFGRGCGYRDGEIDDMVLFYDVVGFDGMGKLRSNSQLFKLQRLPFTDVLSSNISGELLPDDQMSREYKLSLLSVVYADFLPYDELSRQYKMFLM